MRMHKLVTLLVALLVITGAVACAPSGGQESPAVGNVGQSAALASAADANTTDAGAPVDAAVSGTLAAPLATPNGQVVDVTPMSQEELAAQPPGQTEGGAAAPDSGEVEPGGVGEAGELPSTADWVAYVDSTLGFSVAYPPNFIVRPAGAARLTGLIPLPSASIYFVDPATAESALAGTDAPDLEVRVFETGAVASLADWLSSAGVGADQTQTATQIGSSPAVEVCVSTMIFPQCSTFVAGPNRVYQLRALNLEGEAMMQTFAATP